MHDPTLVSAFWFFAGAAIFVLMLALAMLYEFRSQNRGNFDDK